MGLKRRIEMKYTKEDLYKLTDVDLAIIYQNKKNSNIKLFKLKNGNFSVYKYGNNVYESRSERNAKIEFILVAQSENKTKEYDFMENLNSIFGSKIFK
jgi:hypothetical protein